MMVRRDTRRGVLVAALLVACSSPDDAEPDSKYEARAVSGVHDGTLADIDELLDAVKELQAAAPTPAGRGWDAALDADAIAGMKTAWYRARSAYERSEGLIAPLFPDTDAAIDARYEDFLAASGSDDTPFDAQGVTGMHAIERILWADSTPGYVVELEKSLPGYVPAKMPSTEAEAKAFKAELCERLVTDVTTLRSGWQPLKLHVLIALQGLTSLMKEQREKVVKAASSEEESRYSQRTMVDLRDNLQGTRAAYAHFSPWVVAENAAADQRVSAGFGRLDAAYTAIVGDAFPAVPASWSSEEPSATDLATPFGALYTAVTDESNPANQGSLVSDMAAAAAVIGHPLPQ